MAFAAIECAGPAEHAILAEDLSHGLLRENDAWAGLLFRTAAPG